MIEVSKDRKYVQFFKESKNQKKELTVSHFHFAYMFFEKQNTEINLETNFFFFFNNFNGMQLTFLLLCLMQVTVAAVQSYQLQ